MSTIVYDFGGKTALITGATKGIGRDIAQSLARAGCSVGITGRDTGDLEEVSSAIHSTGVRCEAFRADLAVAAECESMAEFFASRFSTIDFLINNAGLSYPEKLVQLDVKHWDTTLAVNLRAPALITKVIARKMIAQGAGSIVNISSNASLAGIDEHAAYCASKFGLDGLTKVMAVELGPLGIRVNAVAPTVVLTPMGTQVWGDPQKADPVKARIPLGRFVMPEEVTAAVLYLLSDTAGMVHGETIIIDGGVHAALY